MLRRKSGQERFFDHWSARYEESLRRYRYAVPEEVFRAAQPHLVHHQAQDGGTLRLLDLGIGTGLCSAPFRERGGFHITGVDSSARMLALCRKKAVADDLVRLDIQRDPLPFDAETFDVVIAGGVLEFIAEPEYLFEEISRALRPQGIAILTYETPRTRDLYKPGLFDGVLEDQPERVVVSRAFTRLFVPSLYRKYLFDPDTIELGLQLAHLTRLSVRSFAAYHWPGGREISYDIVVCKKL